MVATRKEIEKWLNTQIKAAEMMHQVLVLTEKEDEFSEEMVPDIELYNFSIGDDLQIKSTSLRLVAKELDLPIEISDFKCGHDDTYSYHLAITYNDFRFIALETEEEYQKAEQA